MLVDNFSMFADLFGGNLVTLLIASVVLVALVMGLAFVYANGRRRGGKTANDPSDERRHELETDGSQKIAIAKRSKEGKTPAAEQNAVAITKFVVGERPNQPVLTIRPLANPDDFRKGTPLDAKSGAISRLGNLLQPVQAFPAMFIAASSNSKRIMEVVINGKLTTAANGEGLRGFAMGPSGISEQARLFEVSNLQTMLKATAIWQVASVIVAQKHLADISHKLDEIKEGIDRIASFLNQQRRARIEATYHYLNQACLAIRGGELSSNIRQQLEACERDLLEIQIHLQREYEQIAEKRVEHRELFGTGDLATDISGKIQSLDDIGHQLTLCLKARMATFYILSLYPGESQLKSARLDSIQKSFDSLATLRQQCASALSTEIAEFSSVVNSTTTLERRRAELIGKLDSSLADFAQRVEHNRTVSDRVGTLFQADEPTRVLLLYDKGRLVGARQG